MSVGNFMTQYQNAFKNASEEEILEMAKASISNFISQSGMHTPKLIFQAMIWGANVGVATKSGSLNEKEKKITDEVFNNWNGDMEDIYAMISQEVKEEEFQFFKMVGMTPVGIEMLKYILAFAYIDGEMEEEIAEKLEDCFGMALLGSFFNSDTDD